MIDLCRHLRWKSHARDSGDPREILASAANMSADAFALKHLFVPIDVRRAEWRYWDNKRGVDTGGHLRLEPDHDYRKVIDDAAKLGAEGLDRAIVYLPVPYDPAVLEPLAEAVRDSGLWTPIRFR